MTGANTIDCTDLTPGAVHTVKPGTVSWNIDTWDSTWPATFDVTQIDPSLAITWNDQMECGIYWDSPDGCYGILKPWALGKVAAPSSTATGDIIFYHWLANKDPTDPSKVFQIELQQNLQLMVFE